MHKQQSSLRLFRLFATFAVIALIFSQFVGAAQAQGPTPPGGENVDITDKPDLDEVQNYYGRLADLQGKIGVVVELEDTPAALIYAEGASQAPALAKNQVQQIESAQASFMGNLQAEGIQATELYRTQKVYNGIWMRMDAKDVEKLATMPGVLAIHPMIPKKIEHTTSVPLVGAPQVWGGLGGFLGEDITIGVIDTGIDYVHTNFGGPGVYTGQDFTQLGEAGNLFPTAKVVGGWDFAGDDYNADPDSASYDPVPAPDADPMDCNGHGSHVSGSAAGLGVLPDGSTYLETGSDTYANLATLASVDYISKFRIGPGVAPKASLYGLRVFGCEGSTDLTEQAIEWAMDPNNDGDLSDHLDVINMSLGSNFGSEYDTSAAASNNAAQAGVIVVTSSGNSGDVFYITGAPGMARYAISAANTVDSGAVVSAFEATAPAALVGTHPAVEAAFGPDPGTPGLTGDVVTTTPANGCAAITSTVTGKIALIDRGTCSFDVKVINAQTAGAIGVIVANNVAGFPFGMGASGTVADPTIPSMMTTKAVGDAIKAQLAVPATVTVRLTSQYKDQFQLTDTAVEDTLVSSSSRGLARGNSLLKPDIAAPGDSIFSTATGTGNLGVSYGGTSMASPHVAGIMALLLEQHPDWSVPELKALAMNTATNDLYTGLSHGGTKYTPTRIGAGRASVANAVQSEVVAYNKSDPGQVSLAFGVVKPVTAQVYTKSILVSNKGATAQSYNVNLDSRYQDNPGLVFTLLNAGGAALSNPVTIPGYGTLEIKVQVSVNPLTLTRAIDPTIATSSRQRFSEGGGYVTLTSTGSEPLLRLPVHIAARPAAAMSVTESSLPLPIAASGTFDLTLSGTPVDTTDDTSLAYILEYMGEDPNESSSSGINNAADLQYVGLATNYPFKTFANGKAFFGVSTYGRWDTSNSVEFDIYVDIDEDSTYDYVIFNSNQGFFTGTTDDVMVAAFCPLPGSSGTGACDYWTYANHYSGGINTNLFQNNVMVLPLYFTDFGLVDGVNTDFNFYVKTFSRDATGVVDTSDVYSFDIAAQSFDTVDPTYTGAPVWYDVQAANATFTIGYDKANFAANNSTGLLFLRTHNAANTAQVVQVLLLPYYTVSGALGANGAGANLAFTGGTTTADGSGNYAFSVVSGWTGTITPAKTGYAFTPPSITISTPVTADLPGQNFTTAITPDDVITYRRVTGGAYWLNYDFATAGFTNYLSIGDGGTTATCYPAPMDFDGDGIDEPTHLCGNSWYFYETNGTFVKSIWAYMQPGDMPVPGDYDGDGTDEVAVYRRVTGGAYWLFYDFATASYTNFIFLGDGSTTDTCYPVAMDFDGDGIDEPTHLCGGGWHFFETNGSFVKSIFTYVQPGDMPAPGDYNGDGTDDVAVYRQTTGGAYWLFYNFATAGYTSYQFTGGRNLSEACYPAPMDFDGDGSDELTHLCGGGWHFFETAGSFVKSIFAYMQVGDKPVPGQY